MVNRFSMILEDYKGKNRFTKFIFSIQDWADNGPINHAAIYIKEDICLEQNFTGLNWRSIKSFKKKNIKVKELIDKPEDFEEMMEAVVAEYVDSAPNRYGYWDLLKQAFVVLYKKIFNKQEDENTKIYVPDTDKDFCSELVRKLYYYCGIVITKRKPSPNDLDRSKLFRNIF